MFNNKFTMLFSLFDSGCPIRGKQGFEVGKYKGLSPEEIAQEGDFDYLRWAYHNMKMSKGLKESIAKVANL